MNPAPRIYLVRHGESFGNLTGDYSTSTHDNLTDKGWAQARALAAQWSGGEFDRVVVSTLARARQTAQPLLERLGMRADLWSDLAECCWQEPRTLPAHEPEFPLTPFPLDEKEKPWFTGESLGTPAENENYQDGMRRMRRVARSLDDLCRSGASVLAVSHGYSISKLVVLLSGRGHEDDLYDIENTGVTTLVATGGPGRYEVESFNVKPLTQRDAVLDRP